MAETTRRTRTARAAKKAAPAKKAAAKKSASPRKATKASKTTAAKATKATKATASKAAAPTSDLPVGLALSWGLSTPGRRGPKPAFTVAQVVSTAVSIADRDGETGVSMPRVAEAFGLTTSALYRYVRDKDELVVLMADSALGAVPDGVRRSPDLAHRGRRVGPGLVERFEQHVWLLAVPAPALSLGPNSLQWSEALAQALDRTSLSVADRLGLAALLESYARGVAVQRRSTWASLNATQTKAVDGFLATVADASTYPVVSGLAAGTGYVSTSAAEDFGLERILDGVAALVDKKS